MGCQTHFKHQRSLVSKYSNQDFVLLGVNSDKDTWITEHLIEKGTVNWRNVHFPSVNRATAAKWNIEGWPTRILIDKEGVVRSFNLYGSGLDAEIDKLLGIENSREASETK